MKPVLALVGRPNVGKSTLFNRLTKSRDALVADFAGLTRDRKYGEGVLGNKEYLLIDTGGLSGESDGIDPYMESQTMLAIEEANHVLFMVDARAGLTGMDQTIVSRLRGLNKTIILVVNKVDGLAEDHAASDFYALGLDSVYQIAASQGRGVTQMIEDLLVDAPDIDEDNDEHEDDGSIKIAFVGRPNVGKSTLINRIMGEQRVVAFDKPGTTRDSVYIPFEKKDQAYTLIDTAGVRRRGKVTEVVEKFSIIKTLQAIDDTHVVIMLLDAHEKITEQDAHLLGMVLATGRSLVIAINKWDGIDEYQREQIKKQLELRLPFLDFADKHFISALHGTGVGHLFDSVQQAYESSMLKVSTARMTKILESAVFSHTPPMVSGRRIKLRYAHQGGSNPFTIVIHGNMSNKIPGSYKRYLMNYFSKTLALSGTQVRVEFKVGENPYAGKKSKMTKRQEYNSKRRQRVFKKK